MLRTELAESYLASAKELFIDSLPQNTSASVVVILNVIEAARLSARCSSIDNEDTSSIHVSVSSKCLENLSFDLDLEDESQNAFFEWRLSWLTWHELAHWHLGHISLYREEGWIDDVGILEEHIPRAIRGSSEAEKFGGPETHHLAHLAELEADAYATRRLYALMAAIPVSDDDHGNTPEDDLQFCYYTIMTTISCFFAGSDGLGKGQFHPSWSVRSLNVFVSLFRMHLERNGVLSQTELGRNSSGLAAQAERFITRTIQPTVSGIENYAHAIGCPIQVHQGTDEGLFDPVCLMDVFTGESENEVVREYLGILRHQKEVSGRTKDLRAARGIDTSVTATIERL